MVPVPPPSARLWVTSAIRRLNNSLPRDDATGRVGYFRFARAMRRSKRRWKRRPSILDRLDHVRDKLLP